MISVFVLNFSEVEPLPLGSCAYQFVLSVIQGNDHRFTAGWSTKLGFSSYSKSFIQASEANWCAMLSEVHQHAWTVFRNNQAEIEGKTGQTLGDTPFQTPGTIPDEVVGSLRSEISSLPPKKKYAKRL